MGFDNLVTVSGSSIVFDFMSKMSGFSTVFSSCVIIFDWVISCKRNRSSFRVFKILHWTDCYRFYIAVVCSIFLTLMLC